MRGASRRVASLVESRARGPSTQARPPCTQLEPPFIAAAAAAVDAGTQPSRDRPREGRENAPEGRRDRPGCTLSRSPGACTRWRVARTRTHAGACTRAYQHGEQPERGRETHWHTLATWRAIDRDDASRRYIARSLLTL